MGGNAEGVLDFYKNYDIENYSRLNYFCLDISDNMLKRLDEHLSTKHHWLSKNKRLNFLSEAIEEISLESKEKVFFLMFELLDNLPHDKLIIDLQRNLVYER